MEAYQERVVNEYESLVAKVTNLASYLAQEPKHEFVQLLQIQLQAMRTYEYCLVMRLRKWFPNEY